MRLPWWMKSWTIWVGAVGVGLCFIPATRAFIHQAEVGLIQFQALLHVVLRFKTEFRKTKLTEKKE